LEQYKKTGRDTFMLPMNRNELADFLNVTRPSLSREMSRLREEGVIDFHMESIKILQVDVLIWHGLRGARLLLPKEINRS
jgi:DNA-binding transcriptional regulator LsrR (DeoR family)